ncbi:ectomycorrhiza-regulated small secreted protein [Ephemerocybe angulata]|uniref:Ectomycorrhiza-regulated small secreted protein n=1 Tax=Ephemerocybe angulata TaxID=980116 RepID=A0A8H6HEY3_9AGAR|nr:ectomycorrhiza-regulated small secreted protein [Tulosesus angulatus]
MKFSALLTGLAFAFALPTVLAASLPESRSSPANQLTARDGDASKFLETSQRELNYSSIYKLEARTLQARQSTAHSIIDSVTNTVRDIAARNPSRGDFTQQVVSAGSSNWPQYNWVICHTSYITRFDGGAETDWDGIHWDLGSIGYDLYWFTSGTFERHGDGGFINWAYSGRVISTSNNGATVVFGK